MSCTAVCPLEPAPLQSDGTIPLLSSLPSPPSEMEAQHYYSGLPSRPVLVARSSRSKWNRVEKALCTVGEEVRRTWKREVSTGILEVLRWMKVDWTTVDVVRIGEKAKTLAPVILWIGVTPWSLPGSEGVLVASRCEKVLWACNISGIHVEIRESVVDRSAGPSMHLPVASRSTYDPVPELYRPITATCGLPIAAYATRWKEGTGGFFIAEGEKKRKRLLLVTARHVVFLPNEDQLYKHKNVSQRRRDVVLFGDVAFTDYLASMLGQIETCKSVIKALTKKIDALEGEDNAEAIYERQEAQSALDEAKQAKEAIDELREDVSKHWAEPEKRVLGHVILSPPTNFNVGSEGYTEDWAVIEIDSDKICKNNFNGNAIDLSTSKLSPDEFVAIMNRGPQPEGHKYFKWPEGRLLKLRGTIPDEELRDGRLQVIKRGVVTGVTIGRCNEIWSLVRYPSPGQEEISTEWTIVAEPEFNVFSEKGDSGAVIVDGRGRVGGFLNGGSGNQTSVDLTYATPITFLLKRMADQGLHKPHMRAMVG